MHALISEEETSSSVLGELQVDHDVHYQGQLESSQFLKLDLARLAWLMGVIPSIPLGTTVPVTRNLE